MWLYSHDLTNYTRRSAMLSDWIDVDAADMRKSHPRLRTTILRTTSFDSDVDDTDAGAHEVAWREAITRAVAVAG